MIYLNLEPVYKYFLVRMANIQVFTDLTHPWPPRTMVYRGKICGKLATNPLVKYKIKNHPISDRPSSKSNKAKYKIKEPYFSF